MSDISIFIDNNNRIKSRLKRFLILADFFSIIAVYLLSYWVRFRSGLILPLDRTTPFLFYITSLVIFIPISLVWFKIFKCYRLRRNNKIFNYVKPVIISILFTLITTLTLLFWYRKILFSRLMMLIVTLLLLIIIPVIRIIFVRWVNYYRKKGLMLNTAVIIGEHKDVTELIKRLNNFVDTGLKIIGYYTIDNKTSADLCRGGWKDFFTDETVGDIQSVILLESFVPGREYIDIIRFCYQHNIDIFYLPKSYHAESSSVEMRDIGGIPVMSVAGDNEDNKRTLVLNRRYTELFTAMYIIVYGLVYYLSFRFPYQLRFHTSLFFPANEYAEFFRYGTISLGLLPLWLLCLRRFGFFKINETDISGNLFVSVISGVAASGVLFSLTTFVYRTHGFSRLVLLLHFIFLFVLLFFSAAGLRLFQGYLRRRGIGINNLLIIGKNNISEQIVSRIRMKKLLSYQIAGYVAEEKEGDEKILGTVDDLERIISERNVDEVLISLPDTNFEKWDSIIKKIHRKNIRISWVPEIFTVLAGRTHSDYIGNYPFVHVKDTSLKGINLILKRFMDVTLSVIASIILSPVLLTISTLIKLTQKGSILYTQERVGLAGKPFQMYKFTTMGSDAESATGPVWAKEKDPRVTRLGRILRRTSLDELPQLINILKGEMSLVGPRPERPVFVEDFSKEIPGYSLRHRVKPGLTGWAQVHELRGNTSIYQRTIYDIYYIMNADFLLDIRIIVRTALDFLFHKTAY